MLIDNACAWAGVLFFLTMHRVCMQAGRSFHAYITTVLFFFYCTGVYRLSGIIFSAFCVSLMSLFPLYISVLMLLGMGCMGL